MMPEDVVEFLESIFDKPMDTWSKDPGYATRIVGMCPPPPVQLVHFGKLCVTISPQTHVYFSLRTFALS